MSRDYQPISCAQHDRLELAALKRQWLDLNVTVGDCVGHRRLLPRDVTTRDGAEWLVAETESGETVTLRLDGFEF
ncbi:MAG: Rho-binding antiterminator [Thiobacillaceae bacterium]